MVEGGLGDAWTVVDKDVNGHDGEQRVGAREFEGESSKERSL